MAGWDTNGVMQTKHRIVRERSVVAWRAERLEAAGFDDALAWSLARDCAIDLHALIELVERGCPPPLAARILAPLEEGGRPC